MRPERETNHSPISKAEVNNDVPYALMLRRISTSQALASTSYSKLQRNHCLFVLVSRSSLISYPKALRGVIPSFIAVPEHIAYWLIDTETSRKLHMLRDAKSSS
jgi:hypothetical protein